MVNVRNFIPSDRENYILMGKDFYSGEGVLAPVPEENFTATFSAVLSGNKGVRGVIIEKDGVSSGYALIPSFWSCEGGGECAVLDELYILPEFRGKGIGTAFMEWLMKEYAQTPRIRLEVCPQNPRVRKLYERFGFENLDYGQMTRDLF